MTTQSEAILVTPDNFNRAECHLSFSSIVKEGGLGKFVHHRELIPVDFPIVRPNRDTLYSMGIFDLDAGPVAISMPDTGTRFMSLQLIDEDQYCPNVFYGKGSYTITREQIGTRYVSIGIRTLVDPANPKDLEQVHGLQDAIKFEQKGGPGKWEVPNYDQASQKKVRDALLLLAETLPDTKRMFGARNYVDPVRHLIGTAMGIGGNPEKDALYLTVTPAKNDGATIHRLTVPRDVPVDAFWSITVYDAQGHFAKNELDIYSLNNITAKKDANGSFTIQFGSCDGKIQNCLPITSGWNYTVRLYRPRREILNGTYKFPDAQPVS
jgi:hypothetical protein